MRSALRVCALLLVGCMGAAYAQVQFELTLQDGWNLFSIPIEPDDPDIDAVFGRVDSGVFWGWNPTKYCYESVQEIHPCWGYWVYHNGDPETIAIVGTTVGANREQLPVGWHPVGPIAAPPYGCAMLASDPADSLLHSSYEWHAARQAYGEAGHHVDCGNILWVYAARSCTLRSVTAPEGMVAIPGGTFEMGDSLGDSYNWELPVHTVSVSSFYMSTCEITNEHMREVMQWAYDNGKVTATSSTVQNAQGSAQELLDLDAWWSDCQISYSNGTFAVDSGKGSYPCLNVSWYGAVAYCNYRSEKEGLTPCYDLSDWSCDWSANGYRLPTEAEWEYAARGGLAVKRFPWGDTITHDLANYYSDIWDSSYDVSSTPGYHPDYDDGGDPYTSPVGAFPDNVYGLYDMAGNVYEWCWDWHGSYTSASQTDPTGPDSGSGHVIRGGGWHSSASSSRCAARHRYNPGTAPFFCVGLRLVLPATGRQ